jgi:Tol biopolymer transport system component
VLSRPETIRPKSIRKLVVLAVALATALLFGNGSTQARNTTFFDDIRPSVTINQALGQADPTRTSPINFEVVFSEPVGDFGDVSSDMTLSGTARATGFNVTGGPATYSVAVSGMTKGGTVVASVAADAVTDAAGNGNTASTSSDNKVTFISPDTTPPRETLIAFTHDRFSTELYLANATGSSARRLTRSEETPQRWPALSNDGSRIAFATKRGGSWRILVMNADGTGVVEPNIYSQVPAHGFKGYPDWSPDGTKLVFAAEFSGQTDIVLHDLMTGETRALTRSPATDLRPRWSPDGRRVVFASAGPGIGFDLYTVAVDGTGLTRLTSMPGWELDPAFSPDGSQFAFIAYPNGIPDVFVINADGSNLRDLTNTPDVAELQPAWSPAGIAFRADPRGITGVYVMRPDGSEVRRLSGPTEFATDPDWSGDGSQIVFASGRHARFGLAVSYRSGGYRRLTNGPWFDTDPAWSPDGTRLAFARSRNRPQSDILTISAMRGPVRNLTRGRGINWAPAWSPDGRRIAFVRFESFGAQLWLMNADGSKQRPLTSKGSWNDHPSWSPDGRRIVYSARRNGNYDLYVLDLLSGRERRLTRTPGPEFSPGWSPAGSLIVFVAHRSDSAFSDIWVMKPNGKNARPVTGGIDNKTQPAWSPRGDRIIYQREYFLGHDLDLWLYDLSKGAHERAMSGDWNEESPSWGTSVKLPPK